MGEEDDREVEIERLVTWIAGDFEEGEEAALDRDADAMRRLREIAADVRHRWYDNRSVVEVKIALPNIRIDKESYDYEIELDGDDLDGIFDGTDEPVDVQELRTERAKTEEEHERDRQADRDREEAEDRKRKRADNMLFLKVIGFSGAVVSLVVVMAILEKHEKHEKKEEQNIKSGHAGDKVTGQRADCPAGQVMVPDGNRSMCVKTCNSNDDCAGATCTARRDREGQLVNVCF
jgi:hypothetical protein